MTMNLGARMRREDRGLSMTELLVGMMLTSILVFAAGAMAIQVAKLTTSSTQTQRSTRIGSLAANDITSVIRMATKLSKPAGVIVLPVVAGSRSSLQIYSNINTNPYTPGPTLVTFTRDSNGDLIEDRCVANPSGAYWSFSPCKSDGSWTGRKASYGLVAPGTVIAGKTASALFTYFDVNGDEIVLTGSASLTPTDCKRVASIVVEVWTQAPGSKTAPSVIKNTVVLRNL